MSKSFNYAVDGWIQRKYGQNCGESNDFDLDLPGKTLHFVSNRGILLNQRQFASTTILLCYGPIDQGIESKSLAWANKSGAHPWFSGPFWHFPTGFFPGLENIGIKTG